MGPPDTVHPTISGGSRACRLLETATAWAGLVPLCPIQAARSSSHLTVASLLWEQNRCLPWPEQPLGARPCSHPLLYLRGLARLL